MQLSTQGLKLQSYKFHQHGLIFGPPVVHGLKMCHLREQTNTGYRVTDSVHLTILEDSEALAAIETQRSTDVCDECLTCALTQVKTGQVHCVMVPQNLCACLYTRTLRSVTMSGHVKYKRNSLACKMQEVSACNTGDSACNFIFLYLYWSLHI